MIKTENVRINEKEFLHTWSDIGMKIHGGFPESDYDEAYDPAELGRTYTETDIPIDSDSTDEASDVDYQNALESMGVVFEED